MNLPKGQLTARGIAIGVVGCVVITAASAYTALKMGALPWPIVFAAIVSLFFLKALNKGHADLNEANVTHTVMSAGSMVAGGLAFTIPAAWMLGFADQTTWPQLLAVALGGSHEHARAVKILGDERFGRLGAEVAEEDDEGIAVRGLDVGDGLEHVGFVLDGDGTFVHAALTGLGDVRAAHFGERSGEAVAGDGDEAELDIGDVFKHDTFPP